MFNWNGMLIVVGSFNDYYGYTFSSTSSSDPHLGCIALAACLAAAPRHVADMLATFSAKTV